MRLFGGLVGLAAALVSSSALGKASQLPEGARYVAMGSSFAAGPGVGPNTTDTPQRCGRGTFNYPNLVAEQLKLKLVDATCSGAKTEHVLGPWNEVAPQIDSVDADTRLVTVTIGGNDIAFVGNIFAAFCEKAEKPEPRCRPWSAPTETEWQADENRMRDIVRGIKSRAPKARIVFVDYITVLPAKAGCAEVPMSAERLAYSQSVAKRLAAMTAQVAREEGAEVLKFSKLSKNHAPCSEVPWSNGVNAPAGDGIPVHPNKLGHQAAADALVKFLNRR